MSLLRCELLRKFQTAMTAVSGETRLLENSKKKFTSLYRNTYSVRRPFSILISHGGATVPGGDQIGCDLRLGRGFHVPAPFPKVSKRTAYFRHGGAGTESRDEV
jgi:hypothetical protein